MFMESKNKPTSEAQKRASVKYNSEHTTLLTVRLNLGSDRDIIDHLKSQENKQGYIKKLIREDIEKD